MIPFSSNQRRWAMQHKLAKEAPAMPTAGWEPLQLSQTGYLQFRKSHAGGDTP